MQAVSAFSLFSELDIYLFRSGKHQRLFEKFGSHLINIDGVAGVYFAVWAPAAKSVEVIGSFNNWAGYNHRLNVRWDSSGIWEGFIPGVKKGDLYKYRIASFDSIYIFEKADPYAYLHEVPARTASIVWNLDYKWKDSKWMKNRSQHNALDAPYAVYEVHLGSWMRMIEEDNRSLSFTEHASALVSYVKEMGFTHVEFMPVMHHPYSGSWGYQQTGYFASNAAWGQPQELMLLIDAFHEDNIGVILDWVPSHFPNDAHGLYCFDGSHVYEHPNMQKGYQPDWKSYVFNYERPEVRSFLLSNAIFWLERYHADGLRVDAVASMIYLDYSRNDGEWQPNMYGGRENLESISLLKEINEAIYSNFEGVQTIAEESTAFAGVTKPVFLGGMGFGMKWMMGWMNDTLSYFKQDPFFRKYHHNTITFSLVYAFTENFMLPFSHDEVVHGKGSLIAKMPGDEWQKFANLRVMLAYMYTHPGSKLLFMGGEFGQFREWNYQSSLDWHLLEYAPHKGLQHLVKDLNKLYITEKALYELAYDGGGFQWLENNDWQNSVLSYLRLGKDTANQLIVLCNLTPVKHDGYTITTKIMATKWTEVFNSDDEKYWGSGSLNTKIKVVTETGFQKITLTLPPLGMIVLKPSIDKKKVVRKV